MQQRQLRIINNIPGKKLRCLVQGTVVNRINVLLQFLKIIKFYQINIYILDLPHFMKWIRLIALQLKMRIAYLVLYILFGRVLK